jgi:NAD+ synthase (glutamine-hydrolysing)
MKLRLALAQINPTVGDFEGNSKLILECVQQAHQNGAHLIIFPEMIVTGYPVEDLSMRRSFQEASIETIQKIASQIAGDLVAVIGYLDFGPKNNVAIIHDGAIKASYTKRNLPNYGVFDEFRNFIPGNQTLIVRIHGIDVAIAICEDIWHSLETISERNPGLLVVPNGSPFELNKDDVRLKLLQKRAIEINSPIAYVNMTGGQDDLVFDGDTIVVDRHGKMISRGASFLDEVIFVDIECDLSTANPDLVISADSTKSGDLNAPSIAEKLSDEKQLWDALVVGLRDYVNKNCFETVLIGLSGGIDSALVAAIAVDALGPSRVHGVAMPSVFSSQHSLDDAQALVNATGIHFRISPIAKMVDAFMESMALTGLAEENLQARIRGTTLMAISNQEGQLVLATGNKSELAVGYSTLYGDAVGGFAPIKDIYKTDVWRLARYRNKLAQTRGESLPIPDRSITKEPSAELRPNQKDSDSLPDYLLLDKLLSAYIDEDHGFNSLIEKGFTPELVQKVVTLVDKAEYKRRQYPPGPKVSIRAFGKDRRLPMTSKWYEVAKS